MSELLPPGSFHGRPMLALNTGYAHACESRYAADSRLSAHAHHRAFLTLTLDGGYDERIGSALRCARPMHLAWHPAGEEHCVAVHADGALCLNVELSDELYSHGLELTPALARPADPCGDAIRIAMRVQHELGCPDDARGLAIDGLILELLAFVARLPDAPRGRPAPWLEQARAAIADHAAAPLSMRELAARAGVHPVHFTRAFKRAYGVAPAQFARDLRLERACRMLANSGLTLAEVAARAGFADQSHMTRVMHTRLGTTPGARRRG